MTQWHPRRCLPNTVSRFSSNWPAATRWLIDTGATDIFMENARRMGISLDNLTGIAITHGHDDHTGGLTFYSRLKGNPPVYGHPYIWHKSYQIRPGMPVRITGMPYLARKEAAPFFMLSTMSPNWTTVSAFLRTFPENRAASPLLPGIFSMRTVPAPFR